MYPFGKQKLFVGGKFVIMPNFGLHIAHDLIKNVDVLFIEFPKYILTSWHLSWCMQGNQYFASLWKKTQERKLIPNRVKT